MKRYPRRSSSITVFSSCSEVSSRTSASCAATRSSKRCGECLISVAGKNPWRANTLEWTADSPPPHGNWPADQMPKVYRGPYEYGVADRADDYWPQNEPA